MESKSPKTKKSTSKGIDTINITEPALWVGNDVIVRYKTRLNQGLLFDSGVMTLYMYTICIKLVERIQTAFFGPKKSRQVLVRFWHILSLILEPIKIQSPSSHYTVNESVWQILNGN